jgi:hypothetical protein
MKFPVRKLGSNPDYNKPRVDPRSPQEAKSVKRWPRTRE